MRYYGNLTGKFKLLNCVLEGNIEWKKCVVTKMNDTGDWCKEKVAKRRMQSSKVQKEGQMEENSGLNPLSDN